MVQRDIAQLLDTLERIAISLASIEDVLASGHLSVNAATSFESGLKITHMPDDHFVKVLNPKSYITGETTPFITSAE